MLIIVYLLFFTILYIHYKRYNSTVLKTVLWFYIFASIAAIFTHFELSPEYYHTVPSIVFHLLILFLFLNPIIKYGKYEQNRQFLLLNEQRFRILAYSLICLQLFSILFFLREDYAMLMRGDFSQIRSEILNAGRGTGSIARTIAGTASFFYCYNILLFFYSLSFRQDKKILVILLILSSTSRIFHSLTYMGRDGIMFWILSLIISYSIFKPFLSKQSMSFLKTVFLIIGGFAVFLIMIISMSRFGDSDSGTLLSLINYFGQPINNFGILFDRFHDYTGTKSVFPLLFGEKGATGAEVLSDVDSFISEYGFSNNSFKTFVGDFYMAWGPFLTLIIAFIYERIMSWEISKGRYITLPVVIILMISTQIVVHNYFYWAYYIGVANLFLFTTPVFLIWCGKSSGIIASKST